MKNCCNINKKSKKCIRKDGKIFSLPRKFTRKHCRRKKGFSKKSSCSPFKYCKTVKGGGPKEEYSFILKQKIGEGEKGIYQPEIQKLIISNIPASKLTPGYMLARKEFLKMREAHEQKKMRNKKVATEVKTKIDEQLKKITQQKIAQKKALAELEKQKQIDEYNRKRDIAKEQFKEIQERPVSRRTRSQTKQNREELKKLERYVY
jgi:hypothetical protein